MAEHSIIKNKKILEFVFNVKRLFKPTVFCLFGSRANKTEMNYSDYDFLIVSNAFEGISFRDRIDKVLSLIEGFVGADIEPLCYTQNEFNKRKNELGIVKEAIKTGINLI